jgi:molybdenum cofactor cytidylyltransferase
MGRPKALLPIQGETFLARTVHTLRSAGCDPVLVVVAEGGEVEEHVTREAEQAGARVLRNAAPGEGPITSIRLALRALDDSVAGFVFLPVDHPLVRAETVVTLLDAARRDGALLTVPVHRGKRGHPAVFGSMLFAELADPGLKGGARIVVHRHLDRALLVDVDDPGVLMDIDTPESYAVVLG